MATSDEVKAIWDTNAEFLDSRMGEGNDWHKTLIEPVQLRLLDIKAGDNILDVACGNGQFARKMAGLGAKVTAVDFSEKFIAIARAKSSRDIDHQVIDATSKADLEKLPDNAFDSVVCTMAFMDMENIETLIRHLPKLLKRSGIFVFSTVHPCFHSGEHTLVHEQEDVGGEIRSTYSVKISNYLVEKASLGIASIGQPRPQYYFHRPLSSTLRHFFESGLVMDALEEPSFADVENRSSISRNVWNNIPPVLICRLRLRD